MSQQELKYLHIYFQKSGDGPALRLCENLLRCKDLVYDKSVNDKSFFLCAAKDSRLPLLKFLFEYVNTHDKVKPHSVLMYALYKEQLETCLAFLNEYDISFYAIENSWADEYDGNDEIDIARRVFKLTVKHGKIGESYELLIKYDLFSNKNLMRKTHRLHVSKYNTRGYERPDRVYHACYDTKRWNIFYDLCKYGSLELLQFIHKLRPIECKIIMADHTRSWEDTPFVIACQYSRKDIVFWLKQVLPINKNTMKPKRRQIKLQWILQNCKIEDIDIYSFLKNCSQSRMININKKLRTRISDMDHLPGMNIKRAHK